MRQDFEAIVPLIRTLWKEYLVKHNIKSVINGVSGGLDSAINCVLLKPVCDDLGIPLIGRYIHIETNKEEEQKRAEAIGKYFCTDFQSIDMTETYLTMLPKIEETGHIIYVGDNASTMEYKRKIKRGNIKARLRMIKLRDLVAENDGLLVDNDNRTEHELGFFTLDGDVGDVTPLADLFKTEVFALSRFILTTLVSEEERKALQDVIDAVPTDGLGITSSDVEQFGAKSYDEVDDILMNMLGYIENPLLTFEDLYYKMLNKYNDVFIKVWNRHLNSEFKRNYPYRFKL
jgi:NAD+ synthetase